jgi:putative endonuclease
MGTAFYYAYILRSEAEPRHHYTGFTEDLHARLKHDNSGGDPHTSKYRPRRIKTAVAFTDRDQALASERYLKSPSGRAFAKKRL